MEAIKEVEETPSAAPVFQVDPLIQAEVNKCIALCRELKIGEGMIPIITRTIRLEHIPIDERLGKFLKAHKKDIEDNDVWFMEAYLPLKAE